MHNSFTSFKEFKRLFSRLSTYVAFMMSWSLTSLNAICWKFLNGWGDKTIYQCKLFFKAFPNYIQCVSLWSNSSPSIHWYCSERIRSSRKCLHMWPCARLISMPQLRMAEISDANNGLTRFSPFGEESRCCYENKIKNYPSAPVVK